MQRPYCEVHNGSYLGNIAGVTWCTPENCLIFNDLSLFVTAHECAVIVSEAPHYIVSLPMARLFEGNLSRVAVETITNKPSIISLINQFGSIPYLDPVKNRSSLILILTADLFLAERCFYGQIFVYGC